MSAVRKGRRNLFLVLWQERKKSFQQPQEWMKLMYYCNRSSTTAPRKVTRTPKMACRNQICCKRAQAIATRPAAAG